MAQHVRNCRACRELRDCAEAEAIIGRYPLDLLLDAIQDLATPGCSAQKPRHNAEAYRSYQRDYMRKWRKKKSTAPIWEAFGSTGEKWSISMMTNENRNVPLYGMRDLHTAKVAMHGSHVWHAWITERSEVGIGATESEAIESLSRIHAAINCGFCGKNLAECECPKPL